MHLFFILISIFFRRKLFDLLLRKACPQNDLPVKLRLQHCSENRQSLLLSAFQTALFLSQSQALLTTLFKALFTPLLKLLLHLHLNRHIIFSPFVITADLLHTVPEISRVGILRGKGSQK